MRICVAFLLVLLFLSCVPVQAEINPSVDTKPFFCRYTLTDWTPLCPTVGTGGAGTGSTFINSENSTYYYNSTTNETYTISNQTSFFNLTIGNNLTTISNYTTFTLVNITYSEMNQTVGPQGPQGIQGIPGPEGPMNQTSNMTAGPPGSMNMTPNMTAGPQGIQGIQGIQGPAGPAGATGPAGADGAANMTAGPQGIQGIQGIQGVQGEKGEKGEKGDQGIQGIQGVQGNPGLDNMTANMTAGPQGATGATGPAGLDANVSIMYPISSVYITTSASNPNTLLGTGTWSLNLQTPATYTNTNISPIMTSNTLPSGNVTSAKSEYSGTYAAWKASDGVTSGSTFWGSADGIIPNWWMLQFPSSKIISNYTIYPRTDSAAYNLNTWKLNASTDGSTWTTLDTRSGVTWTSAAQSFPFTNSNAYTYYNISITSVNGGSGIGFSEVIFWNQSTTSKGVNYWERTA